MNEDRDQIFIDVKSANSVRSMTELVDEAFSGDTITVCQYRIGSHIPTWRHAMKGDPVLYAIDELACAGGEITYLLKRAFRPRFIPDNDSVKNVTNFAHGMNPKLFNYSWVKSIIAQHFEAVGKRRWFFFVLATIQPSYRMEGNRSVLLQKAKDMAAAEDDLERETARMVMGDCFETEGEGYAG